MVKKSEGGSTFFGVPLAGDSCSRALLGDLRCLVTGEEGSYSFRIYYKGALISFPYKHSPTVASALQAAENVTVAWLGGLAQLLGYKFVPAKKVAEALVDAQGVHGFVSADFEEEQ